MPCLTFTIDGAKPIPYAAAPTIAFRLRVANPDASQVIHSVALRSQILIEAARRQYQAAERDRLGDLFGEPDRWSRTLRSFLWTHVSATIPAFSGTAEAQLTVPCTFDFNVSAAKYFYAVQDGDVPLCFQFSGTIFYAGVNDAVQIDQIGWDKEVKFRLPAKVWSEMMDHYYPNSTWLRLGRDAFDRLYEYKRRQGLATWEEVIEKLLPLNSEAIS